MSRSKKDGRRGGGHRNKDCRNHGSCDWCNANRQFSATTQAQRAEADRDDFYQRERPRRRGKGLRVHDRGY